MSGHSKWATIKRKKGAIDAKRGKIFTKLVREITVSARMGGGDPDGNPRLRAAVTAAKSQGMPADNITRAIKKGTGDLEGESIDEIAYEGYGPGGVALYVEAQTDNRNRSSAEIRNAFTKGGGNLGLPNSVAWMFKQVGMFTFDAATYSEDQLMEAALEAGADDVNNEGEVFVVTCDPKAFAQVAGSFESGGLTLLSGELTMLPENTTAVTGEQAEQLFRLIDRLEDLDDVAKVYANYEVDDAELERIASA